MRLLSKFFLGALVASLTGALASPDDARGDDGSYGNCQDGSRRVPASAISQAGHMPDCTAYVSTSTVTTTIYSTRLSSGVVTKTSHVEVDAKTTVVKTATTSLIPTTVVTTVPFTVTSAMTTTTTTTLPVVTVTSTILFKRDHDYPRQPPPPPPPPPSPPPPSKCSCIVLFATVTVTQVKDQMPYSTVTTTVTNADIDTKFTTTTTTVTPVSKVTVSTTITTFTTLTSTQTVAQTSTIVTSIPSACADMTKAPVNLAANTLSHPEQTYESIYMGQGVTKPDLLSCCIACYSLPGCYSFNYGNFNPEEVPQQLGGSFCQVYVGISSGGNAIPNTCPAPEKVNFITFRNPAAFGAGPGDFFYGGTGPCSVGIDVSTN